MESLGETLTNQGNPLNTDVIVSDDCVIDILFSQLQKQFFFKKSSLSNNDSDKSMYKRRGLYHSLHRSYKEKNWKKDKANWLHRSKPSRSTNDSKKQNHTRLSADSVSFKPLIRKRVNRIYKKNRSRKLKAESAAMRRLRQQQQLKQLPILASIELIREKTEESLFSTTTYEEAKSKRPNQSEKLLFKDYVLIPSRTKFKHLVYTVLDHIQLANKSDYSVIEGKFFLL